MPDDADLEVEGYRPVSWLAVASLALGIAAPLTLSTPLLMCIPALGALFSLLALRSIAASDPPLVGRKVALTGLFLSLFFAAMSLVQLWAFDAQLKREARQCADLFLELLQRREPQKALQLMLAEGQREPADRPLWEFYRTTSHAYDLLRNFVDRPPVHGLLVLGDKANVRYWATEELLPEHDRHYVGLLYTVTYEHEGQPTTFFVRIGVERHVHDETGKVGWLVSSIEGGVRPFTPDK